MGVKSGLWGLIMGLITGFIFMTIDQFWGMIAGIVIGALLARGPISGGIVGLLLSLILPEIYALMAVIPLLTAGLPSQTLLITVGGLLISAVPSFTLVIGSLIGGIILGLIGKLLFRARGE
ncbi:MAG: hypothetical protein ACTSXJ_05600 [Candidatus Baldrarchaeia archaeon]